MDSQKMIFEMLKSLTEKTDIVVESQTRMESDLKYHIRRTDILETALSSKADKIDYKKLRTIIGVILGIAALIKVFIEVS